MESMEGKYMIGIETPSPPYGGSPDNSDVYDDNDFAYNRPLNACLFINTNSKNNNNYNNINDRNSSSGNSSPRSFRPSSVTSTTKGNLRGNAYLLTDINNDSFLSLSRRNSLIGHNQIDNNNNSHFSNHNYFYGNGNGQRRKSTGSLMFLEDYTSQLASANNGIRPRYHSSQVASHYPSGAHANPNRSDNINYNDDQSSLLSVGPADTPHNHTYNNYNSSGKLLNPLSGSKADLLESPGSPVSPTTSATPANPNVAAAPEGAKSSPVYYNRGSIASIGSTASNSSNKSGQRPKRHHSRRGSTAIKFHNPVYVEQQQHQNND